MAKSADFCSSAPVPWEETQDSIPHSKAISNMQNTKKYYSEPHLCF